MNLKQTFCYINSTRLPVMSDNYKSYKRRWFVLVTVSLLNVSTNALWMSYPAVANVASEYFKKGINSIDLLGTISLYVGIPCCLIATFVYDYVGFKGGLLAGTLINFAGGLIRCLSTFPHLNNHMSLVGNSNLKKKNNYGKSAGTSVCFECIWTSFSRSGKLLCCECTNNGQSKLVPRV